ncbi:hypothetical protein PVK06_021587 [Gossypium arboreum]|uniref:Peptidase C14 caspase domain-containing protein n=1 Tax=Gossypium arboreum TaxID=29729 RepID=A0ABR0PQS0_GOSAR|nr:hypothetical protein PVK06_021587 [Gossypium arboreum]
MAKVNKRLAVLVGCNYPNTEYELHGWENIEAALSKMVSQAEAGDVFYFHYSGHGTRIPKPAHLFGPDEAIVPCDFNLITDETSADMNPIESGGKAYGAFSNAVQMVLKENSG